MDIAENYALGFAYYKYKTMYFMQFDSCSFISVLVNSIQEIEITK